MAVESTAAGQALNVCTGRASSVVDIAEGLARGLGVDIRPEVVDRYRSGDIRHCVGDPERTADVLGFRAETPIDIGLAELATWMAGQEADDRVDAAMDELRRRGLER
jgi:dTDP-L-rhamnose 4-epimerase